MKTNTIRKAALTASVTASLLACPPLLTSSLRAEEGASGHYMPGATASFIDMPPAKGGFVYANLFTYYSGSINAGRQLNLGGQIVGGVNATVYADTSLFLYATPLEIFGGKYSVGVAVPYVWMGVTGTVTTNRRTVTKTDTADGFGDVQIMPFMLGWKKGDLSWGLTMSVYAPSGSYNKGALANVGLNYWTFEPSVSVSWLSSKIGLEISAVAGFDMSTKNETTDYYSGNVLHLDATIAEHLPVGKGFLGVGASAFYYQQVSGDHGSGAKLGGFEGRTVGVGPVLSYATKVGGKTDMVAEVKWLPELGTQKRLQGDTVWFKLAFSF